MTLKCDNCGMIMSGVSEEEWARLWTENANLRDAYHKLEQKYVKDTGKKYDLNAIL